MDSDDSLIDDIYAAAALPTLWKDILVRIAKFTDARDALLQGVLYRDGLTSRGFLLSQDSTPAGLDQHAETAARMGDPRFRIGLEAPTGSAFHDVEWLSSAEMVDHPDYQELLAPDDQWQSAAALGIRVPGSNGALVAGFSVHLALRQESLKGEHLTRWSRVAKHLVRAIRLAFRLKTLTEAGPVLLRANRALFSLDDQGRVIGVNAQAKVMRADGEVTLNDVEQLVFRDPVLHTLILRLLPGQPGGHTNRPIATGSLRTPRGTWVYAARTLPRPRVMTLSGRSTPCIELEVSREVASTPVDILSPAELRLVLQLSDGTPLKLAAERLNISYETARSHCKRAMRKFGVNNQIALVIEWMKASGRLRQV